MSNDIEPNTPISQTNGLQVVDFWAWAYSDLLSNANRGVFAEFIVGAALDALEGMRLEWDAYDLTYQNRKIEVKSSAYLQTWQQNKLSTISFDIAPKRGWDAQTNVLSDEISRAADIYVFCLFAAQDSEQANVLDLTQWEFYVLPVHVLNELGGQKRISLNPLRKLCDPVPYSQLRQTVDALV